MFRFRSPSFRSSFSFSGTIDYAKLAAGMEESQHQQKRQHDQLLLGSMKGPGKIVEAQGGRILRSTRGKDRHSKVVTSKGPRDRRVRLSAHTAIQFYDVQDRLGYDRPSKAVDWLIQKAKTAIDELTKLPPENPLPPPVSTRDFQNSDLLSSPFGLPSNGTLPPLDAEDLRLSLHSFQDPILLPRHSSEIYEAGSSIWAGPQHPLPGQSSYLSPRSSLQSSYPTNFRSWGEAFSAAEQQSYAGAAFGGFSGLFIPARIQEEDDHNGEYCKLYSASSAPRQ